MFGTYERNAHVRLVQAQLEKQYRETIFYAETVFFNFIGTRNLFKFQHISKMFLKMTHVYSIEYELVKKV